MNEIERLTKKAAAIGAVLFGADGVGAIVVKTCEIVCGDTRRPGWSARCAEYNPSNDDAMVRAGIEADTPEEAVGRLITALRKTARDRVHTHQTRLDKAKIDLAITEAITS